MIKFCVLNPTFQLLFLKTKFVNDQHKNITIYTAHLILCYLNSISSNLNCTKQLNLLYFLVDLLLYASSNTRIKLIFNNQKKIYERLETLEIGKEWCNLYFFYTLILIFYLQCIDYLISILLYLKVYSNLYVL